MTETKESFNQEFYAQVSDSIKSVFELTTRVDERVQSMMKKQDELEKKMDVQLATQNELVARVSVLESKNGNALQHNIEKLDVRVQELQLKINNLENNSQRAEGRWTTIVGFGLQLIWVILAAYILYKLGIQSPSTP